MTFSIVGSLAYKCNACCLLLYLVTRVVEGREEHGREVKQGLRVEVEPQGQQYGRQEGQVGQR